jgi:ABC-type branched-subunit amino acid transport system ATPase component
MFAPLGIGFVLGDRLLGLGNSYGVFAGFSLVITALFNQEGIAGAMRDQFAQLRRRLGSPQPSEVTDGATTTPVARRTAPRRVVDDGPIVLRADGISVRFGGVQANDGVSVSVREGQIVGLIGPNGAGKTTFIDALSGFVPASGALTFGGERLDHLAPHRRAGTGLVRTWQSVELFTDLTVAENLQVASEPGTLGELARDLIAPRRRGERQAIDQALALMGLSDVADVEPSRLSLGQQKLVGVARALARRPRLIMMDEPAAGLDTAESVALGERLLDIADAGIAVLLVDHDMGLVLEVCDYLYVLDFGRIIAEGTPAEIRASDAVLTAYLGATVAA